MQAPIEYQVRIHADRMAREAAESCLAQKIAAARQPRFRFAFRLPRFGGTARPVAAAR